MADYHALISRAVAGLEHNTGENRRVLYDRARSALLNQLRGVDPPLDESDITRERLALEEAIRRVEADAPTQDWPEQEHNAPQDEPEPPRAPGLQSFRESVAEADHLGGAAAQARRSAREFYESVPGERPSQEPSHERSYERPFAGESAHVSDTRDTHYFERPDYEHAPVSEPELAEEAPPPRPYEMPEGALPPPSSYGAHEDYVPPVRRPWGRIIAIVVLVLAIAGSAGVGYWQRNQIAAMVASLRSTTPQKPRPATPAPARPKIADRIGESEGTPKTATAPAGAVAQKVVLFEQEAGENQSKRYVGSAIWRTETVSPGPGLAPEFAVRADVEVPERHMRMTLSMRRNTDKTLPASHTIEIQFTLPADFDQGGIGNVPGVLMKSGEQARGVPLAGLAVKVTNGYFLIGLSGVDIDKQRNIQMLKERDWLDIPIVYTSGKRAILAVEKGSAGQRAFEEAFRAWGE
jgi:hypothetical protein